VTVVTWEYTPVDTRLSGNANILCNVEDIIYFFEWIWQRMNICKQDLVAQQHFRQRKVQLGMDEDQEPIQKIMPELEQPRHLVPAKLPMTVSCQKTLVQS
jgi:hypothetical protein